MTRRRRQSAAGRGARNWLLVLGLATCGLYAAREPIRAFVAAHQSAIVIAIVTVISLIWLGWRERSKEKHRHVRARHSIEATDAMTGQEFEHWCARLLRARRFRSVVVCGTSGDNGIDIKACNPANERVIVQCKRKASKVGAPAMRQFVGALTVSKADAGLFMTNNSFTAEAAAIANDQGVILIDRAALEVWLVDEGTTPY